MSKSFLAGVELCVKCPLGSGVVLTEAVANECVFVVVDFGLGDKDMDYIFGLVTTGEGFSPFIGCTLVRLNTDLTNFKKGTFIIALSAAVRRDLSPTACAYLVAFMIANMHFLDISDKSAAIFFSHQLAVSMGYRLAYETFMVEEENILKKTEGELRNLPDHMLPAERPDLEETLTRIHKEIRGLMKSLKEQTEKFRTPVPEEIKEKVVPKTPQNTNKNLH